MLYVSGVSGGATGQSDPSELARLQQEIDARKKDIEDKNVQIEKLVSIGPTAC